LPFIDNWATCDSLNPPVFKKHRAELLERVRIWLNSDQPYTVRFGIKMLMSHFLEEDFREEQLQMVSGIESKEYYVNMMRAWYFATALAKQWESTLTYLEEQRLDRWTHNKTLQKARESFRITPEQKAYLKTLKQG
jgi:3-methyladenine DNA glycosylase AlkD